MCIRDRVYPVIAENEESELKAAIKMYRELSGKVFADLKVGLLHGRLEPDLKDQVMRMFQDVYKRQVQQHAQQELQREREKLQNEMQKMQQEMQGDGLDI